MSLAKEMVAGEICTGCQMPFTKPNGYPVLCRECHDQNTMALANQETLPYEDLDQSHYPVYRG